MGLQERLIEFISYKGITVQLFEKEVNISNGAVSKMGDGTRSSTLEKISNVYPELDINWLKTGIGNMLVNDSYSSQPCTESYLSHSQDYKMVPIVHIDSVGGIHSPNSIVDETQYIQGYAPFTDAREGDICIIQSGDSMVPTCPSGSLLLLRQVPSWKEYFGYGNIFVIELTDGRRITKEVTRYDNDPDNYIWCVSHNPDVPDEELPKSLIRSVWKVIKILINKGW